MDKPASIDITPAEAQLLLELVTRAAAPGPQAHVLASLYAKAQALQPAERKG